MFQATVSKFISVVPISLCSETGFTSCAAHGGWQCNSCHSLSHAHSLFLSHAKSQRFQNLFIVRRAQGCARASLRSGSNSNESKDVCTENVSSQGQSLALTGSFVPNILHFCAAIRAKSVFSFLSCNKNHCAIWPY